MGANLFIDFETRSHVDLKKSGSHVYAKSAEILCLGWAVNDGPINMWRPNTYDQTGFLNAIDSGAKVIGHNIAGFEIPIWNEVMVNTFGFKPLKIEQCEDTMAMAYAMGLPGSLDGAARAAGIEHTKDKVGHRVMLSLCKPRSDDPFDYYEPEEYPEKFKKLYDYCAQDVEVERELYNRLFKLSAQEIKVWHLDYKINNRGVKVDIKSANKAHEIIEVEKERLDQKMRKLTNNAVATCSAAGQLKDWMLSFGIDVPSIAKAELTALLDKDDIPLPVKKALLLRQEAAKTSTAKLMAIKNGAGTDSRVRGLFQYHGASTGRWAGRRVQLQNLPRPNLSQPLIDCAFELLNESDCESVIEDFNTFFGKPTSVISDMIRGFLTCDEDKCLVGCDFSAIEARVLAWLAGQENVLEVFRGHGKIYEDQAAKIHSVNIKDVTSEQRQIGKVAILALGYQGGVGAFQQMAKAYGVKIKDDDAERIKTVWREANSKITKYWYDLEAAARAAILDEKTHFKVGPKGRRVVFKKFGSFLFCKLPSDRVLCYPYPKIESAEMPWGEIKDVVKYKSYNLAKWEYVKTYGGKLCENITQAVARDILSDAMLRLDAKGLDIVMHVHDEIVIEADQDQDTKEIEDLMCELPFWANDLPISAEAWKGKRFRK